MNDNYNEYIIRKAEECMTELKNTDKLLNDIKSLIESYFNERNNKDDQNTRVQPKPERNS